MIGTKPWYLSRTIWAALVTIGTSLFGLLGLPTGALDTGALTDLILQLVTGIMGVVAIFGRLSASQKIG